MKRSITLTLGSLTIIALLAIAFVAPALARQGAMHDGMNGSPRGEISTDQARDLAEQYLADAGLTELAIGEVVEVDNQFYVSAIDSTTGVGALELLVCRHGTYVHPAPTESWNTTYSSQIDWQAMGTHQNMMADEIMVTGMMSGNMGAGMMSGGMGQGMMSGGMGQGMMDQDMQHDRRMLHDGSGDCPTDGLTSGEPLAAPLITDGALAAAQAWLVTNDTGATTGSLLAFPGYVTVQIVRDGSITFLLSVQTTTGVVWEW